MTASAITVHHIGKIFRRNCTNRPFKIKHLFTGKLFQKRFESFWCLRDVTFEVAQGQMLGIIGPNGSGKSTLLRLIGGVGRPDKGILSANGRVGALLDLGAGFRDDLTGRDNIMISGVVAGLSRLQVMERFDQIVAFAELESFLDNSLRTYSSGMKMRLAFAVATHIDPDILLIDEILSVGDLAFQSKCLEKIRQFKHKGCTMLLVSHDLGQIEKLCDAVLWLKKGMVKGFGPPNEVIKAYSEEMNFQTLSRTPKSVPGGSADNGNYLKLKENRFGSLEVVISAVRLMDASGKLLQTTRSGEPLRIEIDYNSHIPAMGPNFVVTVSKSDGQICSEMILERKSFGMDDSRRQGTIILYIKRLDLSAGDYFFDIGIYEKNWEYAYDTHWHVYPLSITAHTASKGVLAPPHEWSWSSQMSVEPSNASPPSA